MRRLSRWDFYSVAAENWSVALMGEYRQSVAGCGVLTCIFRLSGLWGKAGIHKQFIEWTDVMIEQVQMWRLENSLERIRLKKYLASGRQNGYNRYNNR